MAEEAVMILLVLALVYMLWRLLRPQSSHHSATTPVSQRKPGAAPRKREMVVEEKSYVRPIDTTGQTTMLSNSEITETPITTSTNKEPIELPWKNVQELLDFRLLEENQLSPEMRVKVSSLIKGIPRPRSILIPLTRGIQDPKELTSMVRNDPEIAAKILRTVNSSYFRLSTEITSIHHAVTYLGMGLVKDIALQMAIQSVGEAKNPNLEKIHRRFWISSFLASTIGLRMGQLMNLPNPSELSTLALLSSIGNLAILASAPTMVEYYLHHDSLFERTREEQQRLSANAALLGALLAEQWELPITVVKGIRQSLFPMALPPAECQLPKEEIQTIVFCYVACRIGDLVANRSLEDIAAVDLTKQRGLEYYYLADYLKLTQLEAIQENLSNVTFRQAINTLIQRVAG